MDIEKQMIHVTLLHKGEAHNVQVSRDQYHSLMSLLSDHLAIAGFAICNGMGSCGTCRVDIVQHRSSSGVSRLSCEIQINEELENAQIIIPDQL
ncbi:MAG: 2Fe-2S iron-sulfur cluster binding domain-containing protein [Chitinophagaceae bacterium]|nr:2Fe-2S iron-sulfur cluster binding domain-containing protein [Chitinophagaceae bacterium]